MSEWISTKDESKQIIQDTVLIKAAEGVVEAWFDLDSYEWVCFDDKFTLTPEEVTHWMPLILLQNDSNIILEDGMSDLSQKEHDCLNKAQRDSVKIIEHPEIKRLKDQIARLEKVVESSQAINEYLLSNRLNCLGSGSILHRDLKFHLEALNELKGVDDA